MFHARSRTDWRAILQVDLDSMFHMCCQAIGGMRDRGFGRIINISSLEALREQIGPSNYCAAKAGVLAFTRALALENADTGITANAVAPGYCEKAKAATAPMNEVAQCKAPAAIGKHGQLEDIARVVAFLASDDGGYITGATISASFGIDRP